MSDNPDIRSMLVIDEIIAIWRDVDPVECYAAGLDDCQGKFFTPNDAARAEILRRIENARSGLPEIANAELRAVANKLLSSISVAMAVESPDQQILACFIAIWYAILKEEQQEPFVKTLLDRAVELVSFEHSRWRGRQFTGEVRKAVVDACSSLAAILLILASKNPDVIDGIENLSATVANFRSLFSFPISDTTSLDELFEFFETNASSTVNNLYPQIIDHLFDYGAPISEIYTQSLNMLEEELSLAKQLASKLSMPIGIPPGASLGEAYDILKKRYQISGPVVAAAQKMMAVLNDFVDRNIQDIGIRPDILPDATPNFLKPLVTSGAAISLNYLKPKPLVQIFVTEDRNTSFLTLLNVLVHEAAHAYSPLILSDVASVTTLMKLKSWLAIPFYEATAFHREFELFEAVKGGAQRRIVTGTLEELLDLFDLPKFPLRDDVLGFEMETRIWRIIRSLRTICDIEINTGKRTYVDFVKWASAHTELSRELIHNECFTFLAFPGYTPSYSFCGSQYQQLQNEAKEKHGVSRFVFNSKANRMGLLPWTICVERLSQFRSSP
jgi:hypothetical protein